jgi:hypothetical protein
MARYRILALSFIGNIMVKPGEEIDTDEIPADHWEPLDAAAKKARKAFDVADAKTVEDARLDAERRAELDSPAALPKAPPQEIARLEAEAAQAKAEAEAAADAIASAAKADAIAAEAEAAK